MSDEKDDKIEAEAEVSVLLDSMEQKLISQKDWNDLCRDLELTKDKSQLLGSRLNQWNLLQEFSELFSDDDDLYYCNNISGLMEALRKECKLDNWRLFIDSSKSGLKENKVFGTQLVHMFRPPSCCSS